MTLLAMLKLCLVLQLEIEPEETSTPLTKKNRQAKTAILTDTRSTAGRQSVDSRPPRSHSDRVSTDCRSTSDRYVDRVSTDIAVDIAVDTTHSKHEPHS